jgi:hypothetical protein
MARPKKQRKLSPREELFPVTETTLDDSGLRADLDDPRIKNRKVGSTLSDQEIGGRIMAAIARDRRLALTSGIDGKMTVKVEGGIFTISGVVDSAADRMAAEELAEAVPGVRRVQTAITISVDEYLDRGIRDQLEVDETLFSHWKARTNLSTGR